MFHFSGWDNFMDGYIVKQDMCMRYISRVTWGWVECLAIANICLGMVKQDFGGFLSIS